jgi:hypothetical protein
MTLLIALDGVTETATPGVKSSCPALTSVSCCQIQQLFKLLNSDEITFDAHCRMRPNDPFVKLVNVLFIAR